MIAGGVELNEKTIVDISIGQHWAKHWDEADLVNNFGPREQFPHNYPESHPQSKSNPQIAWCYPIASLGYYRTWLTDTYVGDGKFKNYIGTKVKKGELAPSIGQLAISSVSLPAIEHQKD